MNPLEQIIQALMGGAGQPGELLWWIDERSLMQHVARRQSHYGHFVAKTADSLVEKKGATAVIQIHGVMVKQQEWYDEVATPVIEEAVRRAASDEAIESILLDVDSPGGSVSGLSGLAEAIVEARSKKPVIAQSSGLIASAAYYTVSQADKVYAERNDLVGSIGTRILLYDFSKLFANLGIVPVAVDTGPLKSTGAMGTEITAEQKEYLQGIVDHFQADFAQTVQRGRGFTAEKFASVASGGVFPGSEALKLGLIDGLRKMDQTLASMPRRQITTAKTQRSKQMATESTTVAEEQPVTLAQLKKAIPNSTAEFREEQIESEATLSDALAAWANHLQGENEKLASEKADAEKKLAEAEKKPAQQTQAPKPRGNKLGAKAEKTEEADAEGEAADYKQMALDYQKEHKCRWSEACLEIKRRYPESRDAFGAPQKW